MLNQDQATTYVENKLKNVNEEMIRSKCSHREYIKNCIIYDFGWYFEYGVKGEILYGGPAFGIFVDKRGYSYEHHYVGSTWDTGLGNHWQEETLIIPVDNINHPHRHFVRYFQKQVKIKELIKEGKISLDKSFKTEEGYDLKSACEWLKLDLCAEHELSQNWIGADAGRNVDYRNPSYDRNFFESIQEQFHSIKNEGLYDDNWEEYFSIVPN